MEYKFTEIEEKCKKYWEENATYKVVEDTTKPKYYVLDMFPYPSGAGLHVGHPLGYVASDIYARYKRLKGYNVLHPMGYDAFGLPAEQYAIETGTHPAITTEKAITRYREQMDKIGFSFDWDRQVKTCDPDYYKWTQWIFLKLFNSWYNREKDRAEPIETLIQGFETYGCTTGWKQFDPTLHPTFTAYDWRAFSKKQKERILQFYRLAYRSYTEVNWCEALGCVLANDEVKDGKSERGGYPVTRKRMRQWSLRITEYADRLLNGLDTIDWSDSLKDQQRNWIGRSEGALIQFKVLNKSLPGNTILSQTLPEGEGLNSQQPKYYTTDADTWSKHIDFAKEARKNPTEAENLVWSKLNNKQTGYRFRRQHPIGKYIPDFVCLQKALIVEIDGGIHLQQKEQDALRTGELTQLGFNVIRFTNDEVLADIDAVAAKIIDKLSELPDRNTDPTPTLPEGEGLSSQEPIIKPAVEAVKVPPLEGFREVAAKVPAFVGDLGEVALDTVLEVFTTRPDTLFGATFLVVAPEHEFIDQLITNEQREEMNAYLAYVKSRSDVERQQEKKVTGCFTGSYAVHPFTGKQVPIWTAEYVLAGYGTGAIMAVPADDERDRKFAEKFGLEIIEVIDKSMYPGATIEDKVGKMINSDFLDGMEVKDAIAEMIKRVDTMGIGKGQVNYKLRDASYSRQRYWGEPFPIKYEVQGDVDSPFVDESATDEADIPVALDESELPLVLPAVESYKPGGDGRSPLANNAEWVARNLETDTMPGYAGSSWYYLRYMDPKNPNAFADKANVDYWQNVDVYFGGSEHAVGHLLYSRFWHKVLFDLGYVPTDEPFKKLVNQGMIQGVSSFIYRGADRPDVFISRDSINRPLTQSELKELGINSHRDLGNVSAINVSISLVKDDILDIEGFKKSRPEYADAKFIFDEDGKYRCGSAVEKMSKSKYNVVNPDDVIAQYGADCFRMFEMFLGPIEQSKPWDDKGISGVSNFLKKFWRLFYDDKGWKVTDEAATDAEMKVLHKTIKKIADDIERLNLNTCVSAFMIATNELTSLKCSKRAVLQPLLITLAPFAPFVTEELWSKLGNTGSIHQAAYPAVEEKYLTESEFDYPVSINGKVRAQVKLGLDITAEEAQAQVMGLEAVAKWTNGAAPKKFVFVKGRIINVVV